MKLNSLIKFATFYHNATIRSDMAKRIMYSIIPELSNKTEIYHTQGVVDYKALVAAAEGRTDIIKYGTLACLDELNHYNQTNTNWHTLTDEDLLRERKEREQLKSNIIAMREAAKSGNCEDAIDFAIDCFSDQNGWDKSFGGEAWLKIAISLKKLISYDKAIKALKAAGNNNADTQAKLVQILNQIVLELNVFDGLSHNTAEVMNNLIDEEYKNTHNDYDDQSSFAKIKQEEDATKKLMDSKELSNIHDVYKQVKKILFDSGDLNRFKDWTAKIESNPDFYKRNPRLDTELAVIRLKKNLIGYKTDLNAARDAFKHFIEGVSNEEFLTNTKPTKFRQDLRSILQYGDADVNSSIYAIQIYLVNTIEKHTKDKEMLKLVHNVVEICNKFRDMLREVVRYKDDPEPALYAATNTNTLKHLHEIYNVVSKLVFYFDSL